MMTSDSLIAELKFAEYFLRELNKRHGNFIVPMPLQPNESLRYMNVCNMADRLRTVCRKWQRLNK